MTKKRRRFRQTTTLEERLTQHSKEIRERVQNLKRGAQKALLLRKLREVEGAIQIEQWLSPR